MSFNDLERGLEQRAPLAKDSHSSPDGSFRKLSSKIATHIFRINSNVSGIQKLLDLIGTNRDTPNIRTKLHDLLEATREFVKNSSGDAKELASWKIPEHQTQQRIEQQKVSREYANSIQAFQKVSRQSAQRQKQFVERAKSIVAEHGSNTTPAPSESDTEGVELSETSRQQQQQQQQELVGDAEMDYQDALIEEREAEIREIETGIHELNEIFRDLGTMVAEQGTLVDNIESNINSVHIDTRGAVQELSQAHEYQRKAGRRMACLLIIFGIVLAIVLLAVLA